MRRSLICLLASRFFGLTQTDRIGIFTQIHEIVFHGNGGYDWHTVYNMPIWLRKFTFNSLKEHYTPKEESPLPNKNLERRPDFVPTYTTKASPK